jgi:hypothetical protein
VFQKHKNDLYIGYISQAELRQLNFDMLFRASFRHCLLVQQVILPSNLDNNESSKDQNKVTGH